MDLDESCNTHSLSQWQMKNSNPDPFPRPESSLFALIIGIDEYADVAIPNLEGAVNDANDVRDFLTSFLHVPTRRIKSLYNKDATRAAIETEIQNLATSTIISKEDPILIFFAGHGAQAKAPSSWPSGARQKLQMLVPHDFMSNGSDDVERGQGVLNVRLSHLLAGLASEKSDNITIIFD
ncbi:hypothetical protein BT96DRAFT_925252 [Gymnopus androsaceus JB14]|uniref:Peptidase C14 caspase domain-containing protein n=1 Tax=Gymnopus androsaceus JB14 TaxID=1447944 RepID=A0A6A4H336_9AGAR|nr:hypothetical protein BT96DRAFT_925252 [Gymnopus androsaceus JB14]